MKYNELTQEQKDEIIEKEIENVLENLEVEFLVKFWLENSDEDFNVTEYGVEFA